MLMLKAQGNQIEQYPYSAANLLADFPQTSFPSDLAGADLSDFGVFCVTEVPAPTVDYTQVVVEGEPVNVDGSWVQVWVVRDATAAEASAALSRIQSDYEAAIQGHLDATAQQRGYDSMLSACSYAAGSHPKFSVEGRDCIAWRSAVWEAAFKIMADVQAKNRPLPTIEEVIAELPPMVWTES